MYYKIICDLLALSLICTFIMKERNATKKTKLHNVESHPALTNETDKKKKHDLADKYEKLFSFESFLMNYFKLLSRKQ